MDAKRFNVRIPTRRRLSATVDFTRGGATTSTLRDRASLLLLLGLLLAGAISPADAQQTPTPVPEGYRGAGQSSGYTGDFPELETAIDSFWADTFRVAGLAYRSPRVIFVEQPTMTGCDATDPNGWPFYCPPDETIYLQPRILDLVTADIGDFAPIMILAHEWGHHVQLLTNTPNPGGKTLELQADCLAGVYTRQAAAQGMLDPGDVTEGVIMSEVVGDKPWWPEDSPYAHGTNDERISAFISGYTDGLTDCNLLGFGPGEARDGPTPSPTIAIVEGPPPTQVHSDSEDMSTSTIRSLLPSSMPLAHSQCFRIENDHLLPFDELLANLGGTDEARGYLQDWGWRASANRTFACDTPPEGDAGWVDISLHLFADAASAQQAVDYFATVRADGTLLTPGGPAGVGDYSTTLSGPASNGKEFTVYASRGPLLVRVTGVSRDGIPFMNVREVAYAVLTQPAPPPTDAEPAQPTATATASTYLPATPAVTYAECFDIRTEGTYAYDDVVAALAPTGLSQSQFDELGWQDGAYRVFTCADPPFGRATQIDVVIHRFGDATTAQEALPYFSATYAAGANELRSCDTAGGLVICVTGRSSTSSPLSDVQFVLQQVLATVPETAAEGPTPEVVPTTTPTVAMEPTPDATSVPILEENASDDEVISDYLPTTLPLDDAACFHVDDEDTIDFPGIVERFGSVPDAADRLQELGWQAGAFRQFVCETPSPGGLTWVNVGVHQFSNAAAAAVPFFAHARTIGTRLGEAPAMALGDSSQAIMGPSEEGTEYSLYVSTGDLLYRVSGIAPMGDPRPNVERIMHGMVSGVPDRQPDETPTVAIPTQVPPPVTSTPVPTPPPTPTSTPVPLPTATPMPTPTPREIVLLPPATATPAPAALPTAAPQPTATTPTATLARTATPTPQSTATPPPTYTLEPTPPAMQTVVAPPNADVERIQRIHQDLIRYGEGVTRRNQDPDSNISDFNDYFVESSYLLAEMGVLGGGNGGHDIYSGPSTTAEARALAQQWMDSIGPGESGNPRELYPAVFDRLVNTDMSTLSSDDQMAISKGALMAAVEPWVPSSIMQGLELQLHRMELNYRDDVRTGAIGPDVSYPEYLEQHGMRDLFGPGLTPEEIADAF
jgi:predicted metalloprotease